jgi:hypothetical protein
MRYQLGGEIEYLSQAEELTAVSADLRTLASDQRDDPHLA